MFRNNSKYPRFFIFILIALAFLIFVGMFFSSFFVGILYFVALLIMVVFLLMDKKYGKTLTNHKGVFFLFDFINFIAVIAIIYYEYTKHTPLLNGFLITLIVLNLILIAIDIFFISDKFSIYREILIIDITQLCSMLCIFTYFYGVSDFWFAIVAVVVELFAIIVKIFVTIKMKKLSKNNILQPEKSEMSVAESIENLIQSNDEQGDIE